MRTLFILPFFGEMKWLDQYMENINGLKQYGFEWLIFRDKAIFAELIEKKTEVKPDLSGYTSKPCDFAPAFGVIFEDYIKGYDFWGYTNFDLVYGRLDRFITDTLLGRCDIISGDDKAMNGMFSIMRNNKNVNNLFRKYVGWEKIFSDVVYHNFDEYDYDKRNYETGGFSGVVKKAMKDGMIKTEFYSWHCHNGMENHYSPKLKMEKDGSLICMSCQPEKEIAMFHFNKYREKVYPNLIKK